MAGWSIIIWQVDLSIAIGQGGTGAISFSQYRGSDNEGLEQISFSQYRDSDNEGRSIGR